MRAGDRFVCLFPSFASVFTGLRIIRTIAAFCLLGEREIRR